MQIMAAEKEKKKKRKKKEKKEIILINKEERNSYDNYNNYNNLQKEINKRSTDTALLLHVLASEMQPAALDQRFFSSCRLSCVSSLMRSKDHPCWRVIH
jgi:hypothetical protein